MSSTMLLLEPMTLFLREGAFLGSNPPEKASLDMGNLGLNVLREQKRQGKNWSLGWRILMAADDVMLAEKRGWNPTVNRHWRAF